MRWTFWARERPPPDPLDEPVVLLGEHDWLTLRHVLNGGVVVLGRPGSGKTSGSGMALLRALVRAPPAPRLPRSGGILLCSKPEDFPMYHRLFREVGREGDLWELSPSGPVRFNFIQEGRGRTKNVVRLLQTVGETLQQGEGKGGDDGGFWEKMAQMMLHHAVEVIQQATGTVDAWSIQRFITGAALNPGQLDDEQWRKGFHYTTLEQAHARAQTPTAQHDLALANDWWLGQIPAMADRTRSSIAAKVMGTLFSFNTGVVRELVASGSNWTPDALFDGGWLAVNMPPPVWGDMGLFVAAGVKYLAQEAILRREATPESNVVCIFGDEGHLWCNSFDLPYLAMCRSHRGCQVYLSQSLASFCAACGGGPKGKQQTDALLACFGTKVVHALGDSASASWASELIGKARMNFFGGSILPPPRSLYDEVMGNVRFTGSFSEHVSPVVEPRDFLSGLRCGGPPDYLVGAYVIRSGENFRATGGNWILTSFRQQ